MTSLPGRTVENVCGCEEECFSVDCHRAEWTGWSGDHVYTRFLSRIHSTQDESKVSQKFIYKK